MVRTVSLLAGFCIAATGCNAQSPVREAQSVEEEQVVSSDFEGLCRITKGEHVPAPASGNSSTSSSNGTTITVLGSRSQSLSSVNGKAVVTVSGAAVLHLTFETGEIVSVETRADVDRISIMIDGPDAISCETGI